MNRRIKATSKNKSSKVLNILCSIFVLELLSPSEKIYLFSPWITDVKLMNSSFGQFRSILPGFGEQQISLSILLNTLAERGSNIYIHSRPSSESNRYTKLFLDELVKKVNIQLIENLHEKIFLTDTFFFRGSMNFTYSGLYLNDEHVEITSDVQEIAHAKLDAKQRWEEHR